MKNPSETKVCMEMSKKELEDLARNFNGLFREPTKELMEYANSDEWHDNPNKLIRLMLESF